MTISPKANARNIYNYIRQNSGALSTNSNVSSHLAMWGNGRSSLWYNVDPQQLWTLTFICAQMSFTFFSTVSSSEVT